VRWLISFFAAGVAVIAQLTIVDRITFPGGTGPDLVLLAVAALALAGGPLSGTVIGFLAGLALDVAPPGSHYVGQDAFVFCLIGYLCGLAAENPASDGVPEQGRTALFEIVVTAAGAVVGEALLASLGFMLSNPQVTWPAIKHVLPLAAAYDLVLAPFVLYAAAAVLRLAGARGETRRAAFAGQLAGSGLADAGHGALRQMPGGNTPKLRLSEGSKGDGWLAGQRSQGAARPAPKREPDLKLGSLRGQSAARRPAPKSAPMREPNLKLGSLRGHSAALRPTPKPSRREPNLKLGSLRGQSAARKPAPRREPNLRLGRGGTLGRTALGAAFSSGGSRRGSGPSAGFGSGRAARKISFGTPGGLGGFSGQGGAVAGALGGPARVRFSSRPQGGVLGGSLFGGSPGGSIAGSAWLRGSRFGSTRMGRSLLGGSVFSRSRSALGRPAPLSWPSSPGRAARLGRSAFLGRRPRLIGSSSLRRSSPSSPSSFLGRPSWWRRSRGLMRSATGGSAAGHVPRFSSGSAFTRLTAALRVRARPKPAFSRRSLGQSTLAKSALGGSALGPSARPKRPGRGWLRRTGARRGALGQSALGHSALGRGGLARGLAGRRTRRLRIGSTGSGSPGLRMPRARLMGKRRPWRTGGYR
jgi:rod shape-determining protein MreD